MNKTIALVLGVIFLSGCGGSSDGDSEQVTVVEDTPPVEDPTPSEDPAPDEDPEPSDSVTSPLFPPIASATTCAGLDYINLISAQSDATPTANLIAENAIDNKLTAVNRWETTDASATLIIDLGYRHQIKEIGTAWYQGDENITSFDVEASEDAISYTSVLSSQASSGDTESIERFDIQDTVARFVRITSFGDNQTNTTALLEASVFGCPLDVAIAPIEEQNVDIAQFGLDPSLPPGDNFDLLTWSLDTPEEDPDDGRALRTNERDLDNGYEDDDFFFTADDGGMVFRATLFGATTSENTGFTRSELREMLRRGNTGISTQGVNTNNWVLGYQPSTPRQVGGRGGLLTATLKVDHVATTGSNQHIGRFIIGQIHAEDDEPIRLYFKKFPDNDRGYIYFGHEIRNQDDIWRVVVGDEHPIVNESDEPIFNPNPEQGIELGEIFSYEIDQTGSRIDVIVRRGDLSGPIIGHNYIDMAEQNSGYDIAEEWNYFRAGAYSQNNTGEDDDENNGLNSDFYQATFYSVSNSHDVNTAIDDQPSLGGSTGNQFANINDTDANDTGELRYTLPNSLAEGRLEIRFTRTDDDAGNTDGFISLYNSANRNDNSILDLRVKDDSFETRFPSVSINPDVVAVTPNTFQTAVITWEYPNGNTSSGSLPTLTVTIDGVDIADPFTPEGSDPEGGVATLSFRFGSNSTQVSPEARLAIDDIRVYSDTEGTNLVFEDDFESYENGFDLNPSTNSTSVYDSRTSEAVVATEQ